MMPLVGRRLGRGDTSGVAFTRVRFKCTEEMPVSTAKREESRTSPRARLLYIDNLRILLISLVIVHHLAIAYGGPGHFSYVENGRINTFASILLTLLLAINQAFFMGMFLMVSSYFAPASFDRKGSWPYLKDRLLRLGIPLIFYIVVIDPLFSYAMARIQGYSGGLTDFLRLMLAQYDILGVGPLWFVEVLLVFSILYVVWRLVGKPLAVPVSGRGRAPGNAAIGVFALVLGLLTFLVRIWRPVGMVNFFGLQTAHLVQYTAMLVVGLVAYRRAWFKHLSREQARLWCYAVVALVVLFFVLFIGGGALEGGTTAFMGGVRWQSLGYSVWEQFMCMAIVVSLLVWFRTRLNRQGALPRRLSASAYAAYIMHQPVVALLAISLRGIRIDMGIKWLVVSPIAVALCFLTGYILKSLPVARRIL